MRPMGGWRHAMSNNHEHRTITRPPRPTPTRPTTPDELAAAIARLKVQA